MKHFFCPMLVALAFTSVVFTVSAASESRSFVTIQPNGTCLVKIEDTLPRLMAEQQVRIQERYKNGDLADNDEDTSAEVKKEPNQKPLSDEELSKKLREHAESVEENPERYKLQALEVTKDTVHLVQTNSYPSIKAMFENGGQWMGRLSFGNARFEKDSDGHLRVTLTPYPSMARYQKSQRTEWKLMGAKAEFRLTLPGKVINSGLSNMQENATWIVVDSQKDETLDAYFKTVSAPVIITAEMGGLVLDEPIDSKSVRRNSYRRNQDDSDVPVTEGTGYTAEATSLSTSSSYYFPGSEKFVKENSSRLGIEDSGVTVYAKLFCPKDREMQTVTGLRVLKAIDDKGRPIEKERTDNADGDDESMSSYSSGNSQKTTSIAINLRLPLPQPDAQSIQELNAEAVVATVGSWKEMTVTNLQQTTNEVDLSEVLPGAKLVITKYKPSKNNINIEAEIKGPAQIRQLKVGCKFSSTENSNFSSWDRGVTKKGDLTVRKVTINGYHYSPDDEAPSNPTLQVRFPQDPRREHIKFKLSGLDLF